MLHIRRIAIVVNRAKPGASALAAELSQIAAAEDVEVVPISAHPLPDGALAGCDVCATLGGDGTLLGVVEQAAKYQVPVFGINRGKLGFLANYPAGDAAESLRAVLRGDCQVTPRMLLECDFGAPERKVALNDIVIVQTTHSHMADLRVSTESALVNSFLCDGLIVSTPTGSTAYNLSAGGPLIAPDAAVFALTPICPHTLTNRSLIFPANETLSVDSRNPHAPLAVEIDGVRLPQEQVRFPICISLSTKTMRLIQPPAFSHFAMLRDKLRWV
ncbi:MAG: NAD(+)/NADH kinase [Puniceicoccales bacterium]|jgi:NAD+ kinase|nr:NAD(+)/NADH kinase [Puniceicoccales bacterium]